MKGGQPHSAEGDQSPDIPKSVDEVVEVRESSIPNAGRGVFAKRRIPKHTIIGFYFGVPLTEDEFDCVKEKIGQASQYAVRVHGKRVQPLAKLTCLDMLSQIRYRFTVLDATDENGVPFSETICPFQYINEDNSRVNAAFKEGVQVNQVYVEAVQDIEEGEELFVSYGSEIDRWVVMKWRRARRGDWIASD
jgi:hypothetical protein